MPTHDSARGWVCPFCPLLCDSGTLSWASDGSARLHGLDCAQAARRVAAIEPAPAAPENMDTAAVTQAAEWLRLARQPLIAGAGVDVAGARALHRLAGACGAVVDGGGSEGLTQALLVQQDRGGFTATIAEVADRADRVVFVGSWPLARASRVLTRLRLTGARSAAIRTWCCNGDIGGQRMPDVGFGRMPLLDQLAMLAARLQGRPLSGEVSPGLEALAQDLLACRYAVLVWEPAQLGAHAALAIERLQQIIVLLNRSTRAAGFVVGGAPGPATTQQVFTWLDGLPLRTRRGLHGLEHDPHHLGLRAMLADGACDLLLWVDAFGSGPPADFAGRRIVIATPTVARAAGAQANTLALAVATPGIDHSGHLFRTDGTVLMPLIAQRPCPRPPVAEVLNAITLALDDRRPA